MQWETIWHQEPGEQYPVGVAEVPVRESWFDPDHLMAEQAEHEARNPSRDPWQPRGRGKGNFNIPPRDPRRPPQPPPPAAAEPPSHDLPPRPPQPDDVPIPWRSQQSHHAEPNNKGKGYGKDKGQKGGKSWRWDPYYSWWNQPRAAWVRTTDRREREQNITGDWRQPPKQRRAHNESARWSLYGQPRRDGGT